MTTRRNKRTYLWDHQADALTVVEKYLKTANRAGGALIRMPTGTGKTGVMAAVARDSPLVKCCLIVAPWTQLVAQLREQIDARFWSTVSKTVPARAVVAVTPSSLASALSANTSDVCFVCTYQTLHHVWANDKSLHGQLASRLSVVLIDEGHREPSPEWAKAIRDLRVPTVLFSATPYRNDIKRFAINKDFVYRYPHQAALANRHVRDVVFIDMKWRDASEFVQKLTYEVTRRLTHKDRVIVRCSTSDQIREIVEAFIKSGESAIGIHDTFTTAAPFYSHVPPPDKTPARYWVHQFMLLEGVDDSRFRMLAIAGPFSTARPLVQQIGRVLRNPGQRSNARAFVVADQDDRQAAKWNGYLHYEQHLSDVAPKDPRQLLDEVVLSSEGVDYIDGQYRVRYNADAKDIADQYLFPLSANIFAQTSPFDRNECHQSIQEMLDECNLVEYGFSHPDGNTLFVSFVRMQSSPLLRESVFPDMSLGYCVASNRGGYTFYYSTDGTIPQYLQTCCARVDPERLQRLAAFSDCRIHNATLINTDLSRYNYRRVSHSGHAIELVAPGLGDHANLCSTMTFSKAVGGHARRYLGFTRARLSQHTAQRASFHEYSSWIDGIATELNGTTGTALDYLERFATFTPPPAVTAATSILLDFEELVSGSVLYVDPVSKGVLALDYLETCYDVGAAGFSITLPGGTMSVQVAYDSASRRYRLSSKHDDKLQVSVPGRASRVKLLGLLNSEQSFRVVTEGGEVYSHGRFYRSRMLLWGRSKTKVPLTAIFVGDSTLDSIIEEKSTDPTTSSWGNDSLFGYIGNSGDLFKRMGVAPSFMVCDDLGSELADFLAFSEAEQRLVMVHAKHCKGSLSASDFHVICSQATKNLDLLVAQPNRSVKDLRVWNRPWRDGANFIDRIRVNSGKHSPNSAWTEWQRLCRLPQCQREVWIVISGGFELAKFEAACGRVSPPSQLIQMAYLLHSTWSAVAAVGGRLKVIVRP